nr:putative internalin [uncultured bacterium]
MMMVKDNAGDLINYTITVENTGLVNLTNLALTDTLLDGNATGLTLTTEPAFSNASLGSPQGSIAAGEVVTYLATYIIDQAVSNTGLISNSVTAIASSPGNNGDVTDISDDGDDTDGNTEDDPTLVQTAVASSINATKTVTVIENGDGLLGLGDTVVYTIKVENTGSASITGVTLEDTFTDINENTLSLTTSVAFDFGNLGSSEGNLLVGETAHYTATFVLDQSIIDIGGLINQVVATASSPGNTNDLTDISDDGDDTDGNTEDDPTLLIINPNPIIETTKTASINDNGDGELGLGDTIEYTITVENLGNVTLSGLTLEDTLTDGQDNTLTLTSGPSFESSTMNSLEGALQVGEMVTYLATYVIDQTAVDSGQVMNTVLSTASTPNGTDDVTDRSDDGDDTDGETEDDETVTLIPQSPSIEVTKTATITDNNDDGENNAGDLINYTITVENTGLVNLTNLALTDTLLDGNATGLTLTTEPAFSNASLGSPQGSIAAGEVVTYLATYIIDQAVSNTGLISNSVTAIASSPGNNGDVTDISDDGDDTDGNTEDDPTLVQTAVASSINATKTVTVIENGDGLLGLGDTVVYTIKVENTGSASITGVTLEDTFTDINENTLSLTTSVAFDFGNLGSSEGNLLVGETAHYTATFVLDQSIIDIGGLINQVVATASSPGNTNDLTDISDDGDDTDGNTEDDPTLLIINPNPIIETTKTASINDNGDGELGLGDTIEYTITVENLGNVTLSGLTLEDTLTDGQDNTLTLTSGPSFESSTMNSLEGALQVGEMVTYLATYVIDQTAVDSGQVMNTVLSTASTPNGTDDVTDRSDDGDDTDGETEDDETVTLIPQSPSIEVTKTATITDNNEDGANNAGDTINYTITVENTGDVTLTGLILEDVLTDGQNNALNITSGPVFVTSDQGTTEGSLAVGETATYSATYVIDQIAVDSGQIMNSVLAVANNTLNTEDVSDISDNGDDTDGNTEDDPTVTAVSQSPSIEVTKLAMLTDNGDNLVGTSDIIEYTITVENTGDVTIDNINLEDTLSDGQGNTLTLSYGLFFSGSDQNSPEGTVQVGDTATYIAYYIIDQLAADSGNISNTVTATGSSPTGTEVSDVSDDGDDTDGNTEDDSTDVLTDAISTIEVTKTASITDNGDGFNGAGDIIEYTISVENTGNVTIDNISLEDTLSDGQGNSLSLSNGPFFAGSDQNSPDGTIQVGETATYIAYYVIDQLAADSGSIVNTVTATGSSPTGTEVSDVSDDGDDTDGNIEDDPTVVITELSPSVEVTKTATITDNGDGVPGVGDVINYTITIENTGNTTLSALGLVDTLSDISGNSLTLTTGPVFAGSDQGSTDGTLVVGETATYVATYVIDSQALGAGGVSNTVTATGSSPTGTEVSDVSDDGDDTDGNTSNDPTVVTTTELEPSIEVTKTATITDNGDGITGLEDVINYTITIENTGNTTLSALGLVDTLSDISGNSLTLTTGPVFAGSDQGSTDGTLVVGETATYVATYVIDSQALGAGGVSNTVTATGSSPTGTEVSDVSDDGDDTDGNTSNDPTITELYQEPVDSNFEIFNGITPNDDGNNDYFKITGIEHYPNNNVKIFNRWGVLVYETENYGILGGNNNLFVGISEGRITYEQSQELPTGTYFYIISFEDSNPGQSNYTGYIYINRD